MTLTAAQLAPMLRDDRLVAKIEERANGCWQWIGYTTGDGYGRLTRAGRQHMAHRFVYRLLVGPIPDGLTLDHLCKNRACVNPEHLEPLPLRDNILRGVSIGVKNAAKTHCKYGHEFTPENTYVNRGKRRCRECGRRTTAAWHEQQRQARRAAA